MDHHEVKHTSSSADRKIEIFVDEVKLGDTRKAASTLLSTCSEVANSNQQSQESFFKIWPVVIEYLLKNDEWYEIEQALNWYLIDDLLVKQMIKTEFIYLDLSGCDIFADSGLKTILKGCRSSLQFYEQIIWINLVKMVKEEFKKKHKK